MALIQCPSCGKRMSSKAKTCPHCQFVTAGQSQDDLKRESIRLKQQKVDKINSQSMLALLIAIAGFAYFFLQQPTLKTPTYFLSVGAILVGVFGFLINRVRLVLVKRK
ncbi:hypothetical protein CWI84_00545 [Idiomarina tyrosinivorans]|uniref:Zinc ribbon domain-containing protein n=1 Tax=Idiomarina tyrosinivorans TaxID=1445662 RepID=A0A432ZTM2_9GAMM|nr:zinc ribbon domain-containing protein [Idiomarina tyrosinivorans]RUO81285.1 hypothetical protein CWI84_00545 [Idiomarina tyrosinivorans]